MAKTIKVEWNAEDIQTLVRDWMGTPITKAMAENIIKKIKADAEDRIATAGYSVIANLIERI